MMLHLLPLIGLLLTALALLLLPLMGLALAYHRTHPAALAEQMVPPPPAADWMLNEATPPEDRVAY